MNVSGRQATSNKGRAFSPASGYVKNCLASQNSSTGRKRPSSTKRMGKPKGRGGTKWRVGNQGVPPLTTHQSPDIPPKTGSPPGSSPRRQSGAATKEWVGLKQAPLSDDLLFFSAFSLHLAPSVPVSLRPPCRFQAASSPKNGMNEVVLIFPLALTFSFFKA